MPIDRDDLVRAVIAVEWDMMRRVNSIDGPVICQERPDTFRAMRGMSHSVLSTDTLLSYLEDLGQALEDDRNLVAEKYARMEARIPPLSTNPAIAEIVRTETAWMQELNDLYPYTFKGRYEDFKRYLACELETMSDQTLALYLRDVREACRTGRNLTRERYTNLFRSMGYESIAAVEDKERDAHPL